MSRKTLGAVATIAIVLSLVGCSANKGADTTCGDFNSMNNSAQKEVVKSVLEGEGKSANLIMTGAYLLSARGFCAVSDDGATLRGLSG